jgi:cytochrome b pre-mRNA-processing protein 3
MLNRFRQTRHRDRLARKLCAELSERARSPDFFNAFGVADSLDGRFDLVALHAWLLFDRIGDDEEELSQSLMNELFAQFDEALRQLGNGEVGMRQRMKSVAQAFFGRMQAYAEAKDVPSLTQAIHRNVYRGQQGREVQAQALAGYVLSARASLARMPSLDAALQFGSLRPAAELAS